jgi:hypothetical protein
VTPSTASTAARVCGSIRLRTNDACAVSEYTMASASWARIAPVDEAIRAVEESPEEHQQDGDQCEDHRGRGEPARAPAQLA